MRTYARQATIKGKVCVNCGQGANDTHGHNINQCVDALEVRKQDLMTKLNPQALSYVRTIKALCK